MRTRATNKPSTSEKRREKKVIRTVIRRPRSKKAVDAGITLQSYE
jgi:hypothetical protein